MTTVSTEDLAIRIDTLTNTVNRLSQNLEDATLKKHEKISKKSNDVKDDTDSIKYGEDENEERGNWTGRLDFLLSCLGYAVGLGNVWRFPYKCYQNGGGAFFIPYVIMLIFVGMPIFFLELSLGQFSSSGPLTCWKYSPMFTGVGWGMVIVSGFVGIYYNMIIAWSIYYLVASFTKLPNLPWDNCDQEWNTENCFEELKKCNGSNYFKYPNGTCFKSINGTEKRDGFWNLTAAEEAGIKKRFASEEYYYNKVLDLSDGVDNLGGLKWELALCLLGAWVIVFLCLCKGVKSSGKVVYFTALFPYAVLVILFIRGMTLDGMKEGIIFYLTPDWDKLKKAKVWNDAANQIFFSLSASWGGLITLSSYNRFRNNLLKDTLIVSIGNCLTSVFAGFVIFSFLGYMAYKVDTPIDKVVDGGTGLAFVVYPFAVTQMPGPPAWAILFFLMLLTLGLDSQFALLETVTTAVMDRWPEKFDRKRKTFIILAVCVLFYLIGLILCTRGGAYVLELMDAYAGGWAVIIIGLCETISLTFIYGWGNFSNDISAMLGKKPWIWWRLCWSFMTPAILLFVLFFSWIDYSPAKFGDYKYPKYAEVVGFCITVIVVIPIPIYAIWRVMRSSGSCLEKLKEGAMPTEVWGPALNKHRLLAGYDPLPEKEKAPEMGNGKGVDNYAFGN